MTTTERGRGAVPPGIATLVRDRLGLLSPAERKVGRALLASYPSAGLESVSRLAERAQVSAPTVVRFATRLGFDGFADLQRALRAELDDRERFPLTLVADRRVDGPVPDARAATDAFEGVVTGALKETLAGLPADEIDAATALLSNPSAAVVVTGGRFSGALAQYLALHLAQLRPRVRVLDHGAVERVAILEDLDRRDVVVVLDFRRYEPAAASVATHAAGRGASVVLITDRWLSPVAAHADVVLPTVVDSTSAYDTMVPAVAVIELLIARVVDAMGDEAVRRLARFEQASHDLGVL